MAIQKLTVDALADNTIAANSDDLQEGTGNLYYTDARADARVALLVDSAPSTLDTLNELAAALGDDPNFATTVSASIADKLPLAGGTMTGVIAGFQSTGIDDNATSTAMTLDASGNLLVGKTALSDTTAGISLESNGRFKAIRNSNSGYFGRLGSDGPIVNFAKDGTTAGSIGVAQSGDRTYFSGGSYGIASDTSEATIMPCGTTGGGNDGVVSLGKSDARFKDLTLSGGIYLGGTGSANKLDDVETGTFDVRLTDGTNTSDIKQFAYVKTGDAVHIHGPLGGVSYFVLSATGTGAGANLSFTGTLPYVPTDEGGIVSSSFRGMRCSNGTSIIGNGIMPVLGWRSGSAAMYLDHTKDENSYSSDNNMERDSTRTNIVVNFNGWYRTDG